MLHAGGSSAPARARDAVATCAELTASRARGCGVGVRDRRRARLPTTCTCGSGPARRARPVDRVRAVANASFRICGEMWSFVETGDYLQRPTGPQFRSGTTAAQTRLLFLVCDSAIDLLTSRIRSFRMHRQSFSVRGERGVRGVDDFAGFAVHGLPLALTHSLARDRLVG